MHEIGWEPQLSALALLDAYRCGSADAVKSVQQDTDRDELYIGLVALAEGLLVSMAAKHGVTTERMVHIYRAGMHAAAVSE